MDKQNLRKSKYDELKAALQTSPDYNPLQQQMPTEQIPTPDMTTQNKVIKGVDPIQETTTKVANAIATKKIADKAPEQGLSWDTLYGGGLDLLGKVGQGIMNAPISSITGIAAGDAASKGNTSLAGAYAGESGQAREQELKQAQIKAQEDLTKQQLEAENQFKQSQLGFQQQQAEQQAKQFAYTKADNEAKALGLKGKDYQAYVENKGQVYLKDPNLWQRYGEGKGAVVTGDMKQAKILPKNIDPASLTEDEKVALKQAGYEV